MVYKLDLNSIKKTKHKKKKKKKRLLWHTRTHTCMAHLFVIQMIHTHITATIKRVWHDSLRITCFKFHVTLYTMRMQIIFSIKSKFKLFIPFFAHARSTNKWIFGYTFCVFTVYSKFRHISSIQFRMISTVCLSHHLNQQSSNKKNTYSEELTSSLINSTPPNNYLVQY